MPFALIQGDPPPFFRQEISSPLPPVRQRGGVEVFTNLLLTTLAVTATTAVTREPMYHSLPKQPLPFEYRVPNLLETTLQPVTAAPFIPVDFGRLVPVTPISAWQPQRNLLLTAVPFRPALQPAPQVVARLFSFDPPNLLTSTLAPQQQAVPFVPIDTPLLPKVIGLQPYVPANALTGVLLGQTPPFHQLDWPSLQPIKLLAEPTPGTNLALLNTPQPQPFNQLNWPPLPKTVSPEPFLIPNTTIHQVAPVAPPSRHRLYYDVSSGRLFWQISTTSNPILIEPL